MSVSSNAAAEVSQRNPDDALRNLNRKAGEIVDRFPDEPMRAANRRAGDALERIPDEPMLTAKKRLAVVSSYLDHAEARDKFCRAIQYGSKFVSGGYPGVAQDVEWSTASARKVFRLLKCLNEFEAFLTPLPHTTGRKPTFTSHIPLVLLKCQHLLMATYLALDHCVWAGTVGIYKNKLRTVKLAKISMYCFLGGSAASASISILELAKLLKNDTKVSAEEGKRRAREGILNLAKYSMDIIIAIGLLGLAPNNITQRVTGASGLVSSLISCYQLYGLAPDKSKTV